MHDLGVQFGAPSDWIQIQQQPTLAATEAMMQHEETDLIVATGGTPMVRAAYRSGNPTVGVGSGNTPVYVDASADVVTAAEQIIAGKHFDNGSACTSPSVALVHERVFKAFLQACARAGAHVCSPEQSELLTRYVYPNGGFNAKVVGRDASVIAQGAGFASAADCRTLVCAFAAVDGHPMLKEKLSPVLGVVCVSDIDDAIDVARWMLKRGGAGHTAGIHSTCERQAVYWAAALDYYRVVVNGVTTNGATGTETGLPYTFTVGTGYAGKSSLGVNMGIEPWLDYKRVAFPLPDGASQAEASVTRRIIQEEIAEMHKQR
jgi:acyl-CoA reductase-like NAD-dependent aldehyde dehydrogenase